MADAEETLEEYRDRMRPVYFDMFDRLPRAVRDVINASPRHTPIAEAFDRAGVDPVRWIEDNDLDLFDPVFDL